MEDDTGYFTLADARPIYLEAGADVKVVGWVAHDDGRQPMLECRAFDATALRCTVYATRPEHCRRYDCREDDPEEWEQRAHCDIARHRRLERIHARRPVSRAG